MVTYKQILRMTNGKNQIEAYCLSTDTKPTTNVGNGSVLVEMDTSKVFFYDERNNTWREF